MISLHSLHFTLGLRKKGSREERKVDGHSNSLQVRYKLIVFWTLKPKIKTPESLLETEILIYEKGCFGLYLPEGSCLKNFG